jgi:L-lactate dehydrogenase complex protein LldG
MSESRTGAREEILQRIRIANGGAAKGGAADAAATQAAWDALPRTYKREGVLAHEELLHLLGHRLRDYDAHVTRTTRADVAQTVAARLQERGKRRMVIPAGVAAGTLPEGFEFVVDDGFSAAELDAFDGVLSESTAAIAETGTIVLHNLPGQGRRALSLVPDYHLCIVRVQDVVETVPEAMERIARLAATPTTFVSGPSATADIEMTRIKGVHGPRYLDVLLVAEE